MTDLPAGIDQGALDAAATEPIEGPNPAAPEPEAEPETETAPEPTAEAVDYSGWLKADLQADAAARGLDTSGTKDELIARLEAG